MDEKTCFNCGWSAKDGKGILCPYAENGQPIVCEHWKRERESSKVPPRDYNQFED